MTSSPQTIEFKLHPLFNLQYKNTLFFDIYTHLPMKVVTDFEGDYDGGHLQDKVCLFSSLKTRSSFVKGVIWKMTRESGPGQFSPKYFYLFTPRSKLFSSHSGHSDSYIL